VPAAAVIPAPIAYIKVVVVKKLVVGSQPTLGGSQCVTLLELGTIPNCPAVLFTGRRRRSVRLL
jgi:hypothetical protein